MSSNDDMTKPHHSWRESFLAFFDRRVIKMLFLGYSAGLPYFLVFSTLSFWLTEAGVKRADITFFSWAALGYSFKFVWAPIIDQMPLPYLNRALGQRRSWLLVSQISVMAALAFMASTDPSEHLVLMAIGAIALGFSSATQDIVIDAYRIEAAVPDLQGLMSASYTGGYRIGLMVAGAGALEIAGLIDVIDGYDYEAWKISYFAMCGAMLIGIATTFIISEPKRANAVILTLKSSRDYFQFFALFILVVSAFAATFFLSGKLADTTITTLRSNGMNSGLAAFLIEALRFFTAVFSAYCTAYLLIKIEFVPKVMLQKTYMEPIRDFFDRYGKITLYMFALIATYRIADVVMGTIANNFYAQIGFEKQEVSRITKFAGLWVTIGGGLIGGLLCMRYGVMRTLFVGGILAAASNLTFAVLANVGNEIWMLTLAIIADNMSGGIATTAFIAYLSSLTNTSYTAMQYALFSSSMLLFPKLLSGYSGTMVDGVGYANFFIGTAILGIIPLILILYIARQNMRAARAKPQGNP